MTRHARHLRENEELIARVSPITRDEDGTFRWSVTWDTGPNHDVRYDGPATRYYRTSARGDGVWVDSGQGILLEKQILGTSQFDVGKVSAPTRRRRIVREFAVRRTT